MTMPISCLWDYYKIIGWLVVDLSILSSVFKSFFVFHIAKIVTISQERCNYFKKKHSDTEQSGEGPGQAEWNSW